MFPTAKMVATTATSIHTLESLPVSLAAQPPIFPRLAEQPLCEIEPFLCVCDLLLQALDATFQCLEPRRDVGRERVRTRGTQPRDLDGRDRNDRHDWYEWGKVHVAFLV